MRVIFPRRHTFVGVVSIAKLLVRQLPHRRTRCYAYVKKTLYCAKGLLFCLTLTQLDENQVLDDLESLFKWHCLREFCLDEEDEKLNEKNTFHPPVYGCYPVYSRDADLDTFKKGIQQETL